LFILSFALSFSLSIFPSVSFHLFRFRSFDEF
jgi:hypothetical protein